MKRCPPVRSAYARLRWLAPCALLLGCAGFAGPVERSVDGVVTEGRFIEPDAYALYALAALHEAHGQLPQALTLYERALELDAHAVEIRTRIGAVACRLGLHARADRAFARAMNGDREYGPLWYELALCRRARGALAEAETAALEAVRLDPERYETSLLAADIAEQRGQVEQALRLRDALGTHAPRSALVQNALLAAARRRHDVPRVLRAQAALAELAHAVPPPLSRPSTLSRALGALQSGDTEAARRLAGLVLAADPSNGDALVIALSAADLEQDHARVAQLLAGVREPVSPLSRELLGALSALLARRVSAQAGELVRPQP